MRTARRFITASLTAIMILQGLAPSTEVFAQELDALQDTAVAAAYAARDAKQSVQTAVGKLSAQGQDKAEAVAGDEPGSTDGSATGGEGADASGEAGGESGPDTENSAATGDEAADDASSDNTAGGSDVDGNAGAATDQDDAADDAPAEDNASAQAADDATASSAIQYHTAKELNDALSAGNNGSAAYVSETDTAATSITFSSPKGLAMITHADPKVYQCAAITKGGSTSGSWDTTDADQMGGVTFEGFGGSDCPFKGSISFGEGSGRPELKIAHVFYNNVELNDKNNSLDITWVGDDSSQAIAATKVTGNDRTFSANIKIATTTDKKADQKLSSSLFGEVAGDMTVKAAYICEDTNQKLSISIAPSESDAGLLAKTVKNGTLTVEKLSGVSGDILAAGPSVKATGSGCSAGGLIGSASNEKIVINTPIDLSAFTVQGANASGGFIGGATNLTLAFDKDADGKPVSVKPALKVGDADTSYAGGAIGDVSFAGNVTIESGKFDFGGATVELGAKKRAGGLFGRLDLTNGDVVIKGGTYKSKLVAGNDGGGGDPKTRGSYGGIAGNAFATAKAEGDALHALTVQKTADGTKTTIEFNHASGLCYAGGIVGYVGDKTAPNVQPVAVVLDGASVDCTGNASATQDNGRFGGAVGVIDMNDVLDVRDFSLSSESAIGGASQNRSAGVAGSAWIATIKFSGVTDFSNVSFAENATTGQLVNENYNSLIFADGSGSDGSVSSDGSATGWTFKRPKTPSKTDDLATYGEVIRLGSGLSKGLLQLDPDTHILAMDASLSFDNNAITLSSGDDFAKLAITWQTNGYYSMVSNVGHIADDAKDGLGNLPSANIDVAGDIDLAGTGLTGIAKDRVPPTNEWEGGVEGSQYFSGQLSGNGKIELAVGEAYGVRDGRALDSNDSSKGNGKIYRHGRQGLFNAVTTGATIDGVTIGGAMRFENGADIDAGPLAAQVAGTGSVTVSNATFSTKIVFDSAATGKVVNVGGIFGSVADACTLTLGVGAKAQAAISNASNAADIRVGEAAGYVAGDKAATINITGLEIGKASQDDITTGDCSNSAKALVGGLIGFIQQGSAKKSVNITGLAYKNFSMSVGKNGDPKNGAGGLLGYSWGNATVTIGGDANNSNGTYALTTSNTSVSAKSATEFGGLLYVMSGHLVINDYALDLSDASLNADSATSFGVLLARGGVGKGSEFGAETAYTGLYLEDRAEWATAYVVPGPGKISAKAIATADKTNFDEWIANTARQGSYAASGEANAVISLHTQGKKLYMGIGEGSDNSYRNRTDIGENHKTNQNARYYYNLDRCLDVAAPMTGGKHYYDDAHGSTLVLNGNRIWAKSPEALMIWSACRQAPKDLRDYIAPGLDFTKASSFQIGNTEEKAGWTYIDLDGYSYYPVDSMGQITIKNSTITFHYTDIKNEQLTAQNKSNAEYTQHANMHLALFRAVDKAITVDNVKLVGTVGRVVADSDPKNSNTGTTVSGALVCRSVTSAKTTLSYVTLNGLTVDGAENDNGYAPLLINDLRTRVTLDVQNLSAAEEQYKNADGKMKVAASSLFGNLGGESAEMVTAKFSNISLPSLKTNSIFTHASFLESFGYKAGTSGSSGSYIFYKGDKATYGSEIDANDKEKNEYVGDQLWYYDEDTYKTPAGLVTADGNTANIGSPAFGGYLPYVAKGKSGTAYHELKVNQRLANIKAGCGTYADPYALSSEFEMRTVSEYINNESRADDGWEVTITKDQSKTCARRDGTNANSDNEITYKYQQSSNNWIPTDSSVGKLDNKTMHTYLQSAYYSIEPKNDGNTTVNSITLDTETFKGFGNESNPFRGVIVGNLKNKGGTHTKLIIKGSDSVKGLIAYSYGSVVKDLDIVYQDGIGTLKYDGTSSAAVPNTFFGGVIGCIMGGDNIIDDVKVGSGTSSEETSLQTLVSQGVAELVSLFSGKSQDLRIPVGGYVGAICGGGAIFRNTGTSWRKSTGDNGDLYNNPYVGRVIDGYAFSEGCTVDNGNDNYRINMLENRGTPCVETGDIFGKYRDGDNQEAITTTVKNAQGLLVLSAIIGSGAGAGACYTTHSDSEFGTMSGSKAYAGRTTEATGSYRFGNDSLGKVRNASYGYVGNVSAGGDVAVDDAKTANNDDTRAPGRQNSKAQGPLDNFADGEKEGADSVNSPYLVKNYATWQTGYVCAAKAAGMDLQFVTNQEYDLRAYGTGFTGLSGRYYSNACYSNLGADRDRIVPLIACINGNGARLILESDVKQYLNDDFFLQSWGGLFSAVTFTKDHVATSISGNGDNVVQDLQFGSEDKEKHSTVSLMCVKDAAGTVATLDELKNSDLSKAAMENGIPHLGVGALAGATANRDSLASAGAFNAVSVRNCRVTGPSMVGGLLGNSGWAGRRTDTTKDRMLDFDSTCASPVKLTNCSYSNLTVTGATRVGGFVGAIGSGSDSGIWVTDPNAIVGQDSTISSTAKDCIVGGAFGLAWSKVQVNVPQSEDDSQSYSTAKMIGVTVQNNHAVASVSKDQPDDNKTYRGTGGIIGNTQRGCDVRNVRIAASDDSGESGSTDDYKVNIGRTASELKDGIVQCVGGIVGQANKYDQEVTYNFNGIKVENANMTADEGAGGLVGTVAAGTDISYANIVLSDVGFGKTYSGGLVGTIKNANAVVAATNIKVQNCTFEGDACSAIAGDGKGTFRLSNVLVSQNKYQAKDSQGLLLGKTWSAGSDKDLRGLYVAGLDVVPEGEKTTSDLPDYVAAAGTTTVAAIHQVSYVALADYTNASTKAGAAGHYDGDGSDLYSDEGGAIASASPYVTTNPVSTISINGKSLFSDGFATYRDNDNKDRFLAGKIKDEALGTTSTSAGTGTYVYNNIGGCDKDGNYQNGEDAVSYKTTADSTFKENNPSIKQVTTDFPVLVISGNDTKTVASYLDVVTNGGFSDAVRLNNDKTEFVKATVKRIEYDTETRSFVESAKSPSLAVVDNGKSNMSFRASSSWDNNEGRFTLLTVTFNDGAGHKYKVQVPVVVKRMLEINFSATYTYTTVFDKAKYGDAEHDAFNFTGGISADYAGYSDHVLVGSGEAMTGYLTWTYNQAGSTRTEYGWNTHLAAGGSMGPLGKTIVFDGSNGAGNMPVGTQLTLVDTAHNDKHYTYTVAGGKAHTVALKDFKCATGSYEESWMSELMHVGAEKDPAGAWVIMTDTQVKEHKAAGDLAECAGARIWSDLEKRFEYYWKAENDPEATKYKLTVPDENPQSESFYLIVRTPKNSDSVNGKTSTQISTSMVNTHINQVWRDKSCAADSGNNTPSTYGINSNYTQALFDNTSGGSQRMAETASPSPVGLDVTDTVSFSSSQQYADSDSLYFLFESSLVNYGKDNTGSTGYPVGTTGTVKFYVSVGGTPYTWNGSKWETAQNGEAAASVTLPDDGKDISIPLGVQGSDGKITPIDMRQLRNTAKNSTVDPNKIVVRITSDNMAMSYNACEMGIASTTPGADGSLAKWTKTSYRTYLATNPETLNVSSMMATYPGNMQYYRLGNDGRSTISLEASSKAQLGINVDDLDSANGEISLVSKYDFAGLHDSGAKLAKGNTVTYTFSLEQRQGGGSYAAVDDMSKYIVSIKSDKLGTAKLLNGKYVLEDVKQEGSFKTKTKTDSTSLGDRYTVKVNTAIEKNGLTYANYRIVLTAHLSGADVTDDPDNAQLLTGYNEKHSDYVTYTVTKIKTEGVDH